MALYVLGYWVGIDFYSMVPQFSTIFCIQSNLELTFKIFTGCGLCQDTISTYKLSIYVKKYVNEIQGPVTYFFNLM